MAKQFEAKQCKAKQDKPTQRNAKQHARTGTCDTFSLALPKCFGNTFKNDFAMHLKKYLIGVAPGSSRFWKMDLPDCPARGFSKIANFVFCPIRLAYKGFLLYSKAIGGL